MLSEAAPTDHNLAVLKRQDPHIQRVILTAGHSAVYAYSEEDDNWERHKVEGAFFIVERDLHPLWRFVILNRLNTDNLVEDITADFVVEESDQVHPWGAARGRCLFRESWGASLPRCACTAAVPPLQKCRAQGARPLVLPGSRPRTRAGADRRVSGRSVAGNRSVVPPRLPHAKFSPPPPCPWAQACGQSTERAGAACRQRFRMQHLGLRLCCKTCRRERQLLRGGLLPGSREDGDRYSCRPPGAWPAFALD